MPSPSDDMAKRIAENIKEGMLPERAVKESVDGDAGQYLDEWQDYFNDPKVQKELANITLEDQKQILQKWGLHNLVKMNQLAEETKDDRVEKDIRKTISSFSGHSQLDEIDLNINKEYKNMGAEELLENLEKLPGVDVDTETFKEAVFQ